MSVPYCFFERAMAQGGGTQAKTGKKHLNWGNIVESLERPKGLEFIRVPERKELHREWTSEMCRGSPLSIKLSTDQQMHVRKLPTYWEKTGSEIVPVSTSQTEEPFDS